MTEERGQGTKPAQTSLWHPCLYLSTRFIFRNFYFPTKFPSFVENNGHCNAENGNWKEREKRREEKRREEKRREEKRKKI